MPAQSSPATTPLAVFAVPINGATVTGAGRFETGASQDVYTFTVPVGGQALNLNVAACPTANFSTPLSWRLLRSAERRVGKGYCNFCGLGTFPDSDHALAVGCG